MTNDSTFEKSLIKESDARAIINLMMSCYKAGLKDAEEICDKYTCEDFKKEVRVPGVYGRVRDEFLMEEKEWRMSLMFMDNHIRVPQNTINLVQSINFGKSILSCVLPISQEYYILGIDDFNVYPHIHEFSLIDNNIMRRWTRNGFIKITRKDVLIEIQRLCMLRSRIDESSDSKFSIRRRTYESFCMEVWESITNRGRSRY